MTLLITAISPDYALACSDTRITVKQKNRYTPVDEHFNKHIVFHSNGLTADITYTGVAQWSKSGKTVKLYDVISESLVRSVKKNLAFAPLSLNLIEDIVSAVSPGLIKDKNFAFELHVTGYHQQIPIPWIAVISSFRKAAPWNNEEELQWEYNLPGLNIFLKAAEKPDVIFGGMDSALNNDEKQKIMSAMSNGADAFNMSNLSSRLIEKASKRNSSIGPRSVSVLMPQTGFIDSNLWDKRAGGVIAFLPRMVFPNGTVWGPSEFPAELSLVSNGQLPKQSLFFKSIVYQEYKRTLRRRIFRNRKGKLIPGIMGLIGLTLFGKMVDGYTDFEMGNEP